MDNNKLYQNNPETQEWDVDQSLFDHKPVKQGENSVGELYRHTQENLTPENYDDLYNNSQNIRHTKARETKKTTNLTLTAAAILVSSVVGIITIVNPLTMRPKVQGQKFSLVGNVLNYSFEVSNSLHYDCNLVIYKDGEEAGSLPISESQKYQGEYLVTISGKYELKFISTNNIDYTNRVTLYTFTY